MYMEKAKKFCDLCDVPIKGLTALFSIGLLAGGIVAWLYLGSINMDGQLIPAISSPQTLIALAIFSAILTATIISMMIGTPFLFERMLKTEDYRHDLKDIQKWMLKTALFLTPPLSFIAPILLDVQKTRFLIVYTILIGFFTLFIFAFYCRDTSITAPFKKENLRLLGILGLFSVIGSVTTITFLNAILSPIFLQLIGDNWGSVIAVIFYLFFYALMASIATGKDWKTYAPVTALIAYTVIFSFSAGLPKIFARKLNIGSFTETITVDEKSYALLAATGGFTGEKIGLNSYLVKNVFVHLNLPSALTFSASQDSEERITLPASSISSTLKTIEKKASKKL